MKTITFFWLSTSSPHPPDPICYFSPQIAVIYALYFSLVLLLALSPSCLYYYNHSHTGLPGLHFLPYTKPPAPTRFIALIYCFQHVKTHAYIFTQLLLLSSTMQTKSNLLILVFKTFPPSSAGPNLPFTPLSYTKHPFQPYAIPAIQIHHTTLIATPYLCYIFPPMKCSTPKYPNYFHPLKCN